MGMFDSIGNLFKTKAELKKEQNKKQQSAENRMYNVIGLFDSKIHDFTNLKQKTWAEAKNALSSGNQLKAKNDLLRYRSYDVFINQLEKRKWLIQSFMTRIEMHKNDMELADAMNGIHILLTAKSDVIDNMFEQMQDVSASSKEADKVFDRLYNKEINSASLQDSDSIAGMDDLFNNLQKEVALEIGETSNPVDFSMQNGQTASSTNANSLEALLQQMK